MSLNRLFKTVTMTNPAIDPGLYDPVAQVIVAISVTDITGITESRSKSLKIDNRL